MIRLRSSRVALTALGSLFLMVCPAVARQSPIGTKLAPNDYAKGESWLCRPGRQDACAVANSATVVTPRGDLSRESWEANPTAPVDCSTDGTTIVGKTPVKPWVVPEKEIATPFVRVPGLLTAECKTNEYATYLEVTLHGDPSDARVDDIVGDLIIGGLPAPDWGLHLVDVNLAMGDLIDLVSRQSAAYLARRP